MTIYMILGSIWMLPIPIVFVALFVVGWMAEDKILTVIGVSAFGAIVWPALVIHFVAKWIDKKRGIT